MAGGALWNSGLFAWTGRRLLSEVWPTRPRSPAARSLQAGDVAGFFGSVTAVSIDVGCWSAARRWPWCRGTFDWDDVGTWDALAPGAERDAARQRRRRAGIAARVERLRRVERGEPHRPGRSARPRRGAGQRPHPGDQPGRAGDLKRTLDALPAEIRELPA